MIGDQVEFPEELPQEQTIEWDLRQVKSLINKKFYPLLMDKKRFLVLMGGAGSGKSHWIAQNFIIRILAGISRGIKHNILAVRKTSPSVRYSVFLLFKHYIDEWNLRSLVDIKESTMEIRWMGGSTIRCAGMDDPEKIKSFENLTSAWAEEATEFNEIDIIQLNLRLRGRKETKKQIALSFNPVDQFSFLNDRFFIAGQPKENDPAATVMHSTYKDNDFLNDPEYEAELEALREQDENLGNIYADGIWGVLRNLIYPNWRELGAADWPDKFDDVIYGLDFGDAHAMVLVEIGMIEDEIYERPLLFESRVDIDTFVERFEALEVNKNSYMYADPSRPDLIRIIEDGGFNIYPADNDVKAGLSLVKTKNPFVYVESEEGLAYLKQRKGYKLKEDRHGNVYDFQPIKIRDDGPDAERYGLYTYFSEMDMIPKVLGHL
jgi:phage terminase large subunit